MYRLARREYRIFRTQPLLFAFAEYNNKKRKKYVFSVVLLCNEIYYYKKKIIIAQFAEESSRIRLGNFAQIRSIKLTVESDYRGPILFFPVEKFDSIKRLDVFQSLSFRAISSDFWIIVYSGGMRPSNLNARKFH